jgi:ubiquinone/menaquinone biosynthesis C-methylase UbiE
MIDDISNKTIEAYNKHANAFSERYDSTERSIPFLKNFIAEIHRKPKWVTRRKILDVGCGSGIHSQKLLECRKLNVTGIDLSKEMIKIAKKKAPAANFLLMDMCNLAFSDREFDGLWVHASLHHLPKEKQLIALREFHRVLKNAGLIFIAVKEGNTERFEDISGVDEKRFFSYSTVETLTDAMESVGLHITEWTRQSERPNKKWIKLVAHRP